MKRTLIALLFLGSVSLGVVACNNQSLNGLLDKGKTENTAPVAQAPVKVTPEAQKETAKPESVAKSGESEILARVNGEPITDAEVYDEVKNRLKKLESQVFDIKRSGLSEVIEQKLIELEAKKRNMPVDQLLDGTIKVEEPSEQEVQTFYAMFKERFNNQPLEKVKPQLVQQIKRTRQASQREEFLDQLKKDAKVEIYMERPRVEVSTENAPAMGKKGAPITIVEFSEFQCPFCKRSRPTIKQIMDTYKDQVYYVFRDFPLSFHKQAPKAAEAAHCAGDQGKYWEYNDTLFENQQALQVEDLKKYAQNLALDSKQFNECLESGKHAEKIEKDMREGMQAGVSGTPAFFINGIFLSGAQPFENFKEIIDEELQKKQ